MSICFAAKRLVPMMVAVLPLMACRAQEYTVEVPAAALWTPTGIRIPDGSEVTVEAEGSISPDGHTYVDADGSTDLRWNRKYNAYEGINHCALIARVGPGGEVQAVGTGRKLMIVTGGRLSLGINDSDPVNNKGSLHVTMTVRPGRGG